MQEVRENVFWFHPSDGGEVYIVKTNEGLVMFDSGFYRHREKLVNEMKQSGLDPEKIALGFATHFHCDHVAGLGWFSSEFNFPVVAHERAAGPMETADKVITGAEIPYIDFHEEFMPCPVKHKIKGGEKFTVSGREFETVFAPGHTAGSMHVISGDEVFSGDTIFENGTIGWMDVHWGSHPEDYIETLERMKPLVGKMILPGHGKPFLLKEIEIVNAVKIATFYIPPEHGLGRPRAPSGYPED